MSFNLNEVRRLELMGGAVLAKFNRLVSAADRSAHGSAAQEALGEFMKAFERDPNLAADEARTEAAAAAAAREAAARS
jgi:hypothetical protein